MSTDKRENSSYGKAELYMQSKESLKGIKEMAGNVIRAEDSCVLQN